MYNARVLKLVCHVYLLLNDLEFDLYQIIESLDGLLIFLLIFVIGHLAGGLLDLLFNKVVDHHLVLDSLLVLLKLQEIVGNLLIDINLFNLVFLIRK